MALGKTYGKIESGVRVKTKNGKSVEEKVWKIVSAQPHVSIKLKNIFPNIPRTSVPPYTFSDLPQTCFDLLWFMERYPLDISDKDKKALLLGRKAQINNINEIERILLPDYVPAPAELANGEHARQYQLSGNEVFMKTKRLLLGDEMGLGKTLTAILSFLPAQNRPVAVVVQAHLPRHWKGQIERFTGLSIHIVKTRSAYDLPPADVYIFKYTSLSGWTNLFTTGFFKTVVFDECQELRNRGSEKYDASYKLSENAVYVLGLSGTPIYNYGNEIFNVLDCLNPQCLGSEYDFTREWTNNGKRVTDPAALGCYLKDNLLMLRRTRKDVGKELPPVNKIVYTVDYDEDVMDKDLDLAKMLAIKVVSGSFAEAGEASRNLDALIRHATGVSKAKSVAAFVKVILENGEPIVLAAWHRDVYTILMEELAEYNPVMYTGSESPSQKEKAKDDFISGKSKVFIISLRSGIGLDGLQHVCKYVVFAELDWSGKVHDQVIARVDRDGNENQCTAFFLVSDAGSDPIIIDILALKSSQSQGIVDPMATVAEQFSDESRIKILANKYLEKIKTQPCLP